MIKIGLFLCNCGDEISRLVDTKEVADYIAKNHNLQLVSIHQHLCDDHSVKRLKRILIDEGITNVVIAACSPQVHLDTFSKVMCAANLNPFLLEMVNIREHLSWVHSDPQKATEKAKRLITGAIRRVSLNKALDFPETKVVKSVLVIGAGVAGTNAAIELAKKGIRTYLVENQPWIGGMTAQVGIAFPTNDCAYCIGTKSDISGIRKCFYRAGLDHYPNLQIITNAEIKNIVGSVGNFTVTIEESPTFVTKDCVSCGMCEEKCPIEVPDKFNRGLTKRKAIYKQFEAIPNKFIIDFENCNVCKECEKICPEKAIDFSQRPKKHNLSCGAIIVATGIDEFDPSIIERYGYKKYKNVMTQLDFARYMDPSGPTKGELIIEGKRPETITMIQCVGSRDKNYHAYCSRLCCMMALKHANLIKERYPGIRVNVCYIDIRTTGIEGYEEWYDRAREQEVIFIPGKASEVIQRKDGKLIVRTEDMSIGEVIELESDLVILSAGIESSTQTKKIAGMLKLRLNNDGFIKALDPKVRALATERWGVFMCGGSRGPTDIPESILQANAVVSSVSTLLSRDTIDGQRLRSKINADNCNGCEVCEIKCPFNAISIVEKKAQVNEDTCRGCGVCASNCPSGAAQLMNYTDEQIFAQIEGILSLNGEKGNYIGFICKECGYASSDLAGVERFKYPENINLIEVPCLGRVSVIHILKAIEQNAKGVALIGCMPGRCQCNSGNNAAENVALANEVLSSAGRKEKVSLYNFCGAASHNFAKAMNEFASS